MARIFISYRRDDSAADSGRIYDRLEPKFGRNNVFKDVDTILLGVDFRHVLTDEVAKCDVMLVIIGRQWVNMADESGQRRLDNPNDFVRIEIEAALARDIPVIPLLVEGAQMPQESDLPHSLALLAYRNGIAIRSDPYFHRDMDLLIGRMDVLMAKISDKPSVIPDEMGAIILPKFSMNIISESLERGWSMERLAEEMNKQVRYMNSGWYITAPQIQLWIIGITRPSEYWIEKMCIVFDKSADELGF